MNIDLKKFCALPVDYRLHLHEPFAHPDGIVSTNGHIMVLIPDDGRDCNREQTAKFLEGVSRLLERSPPAPFSVALEELNLTEPALCETCKGSGEHPEFVATKCDDCELGYKHVAIHVGAGIYISNRYLWMARELGAKEVFPTGMETKAYFDFEGGKGVLMPIRVPDEVRDKQISRAEW